MTSVALLGGTGRIGPALALRWARAGVDVIVGSRDAGRARTTADDLNRRVLEAGGGATITGATNEEAADGGEIAVVTVPYEAQADLVSGLTGRLAGRIVVSTAIPMRFDPDTGPEHIDVAEGSAALQIARLLPESRVVGALHTVSSVHLAKLDHDLDEDVVITADDTAAREAVIELIELIPGARPVDGGRLANSHYSEQFTVLLLSINRRVRRSVGVRITNLPGAG